MNGQIQITLRRRVLDGAQKLTAFERFKILLAGILTALLVGAVLVVALIFGSLIIAITGIAVIAAVIVLLLKLAVRSAKQ